MPKPPTFPVLYDDVLQISITNLKEWGYFDQEQISPGTIKWSRNGERRAAIDIVVNTLDIPNYVELKYTYGDEPRRYKVLIVKVPSNLKNGSLKYFLCPQTNKRCRKLYLVDGYFFHQKAFKGMYERQTWSKSYRDIDKAFGAGFYLDKLCAELYKKGFKRFYKGKPTKRYLWLRQKIERIERNSFTLMKERFDFDD